MLPSVAKLELAVNPNEASDDEAHISEYHTFDTLQLHLPNIREIVLNGTKVVRGESNRFYSHFRRLTHVNYIRGGTVDIDGFEFLTSWAITDLSLGNCCFVYYPSTAEVGTELMVRGMLTEMYILSNCRSLQRLSMKNATWKMSFGGEGFSQEEPIPQKMLIQMVRHHPTLRWLRSDLSQENVAMLKQERPEITFVSE